MSGDTPDWRIVNGPPPSNRAQRRQAKRAQRDMQPTPLRPADAQATVHSAQHDVHDAANALHHAEPAVERNKAVIHVLEGDTRPRPPKIDPAQYQLWLLAISQLTGSAAAADALVQDARRHGIDGPARQLSYMTVLTFERARSLLQQALDCFPSNCSVN